MREPDHNSGQAMLISIGGLPATGKTTIARTVAAQLGAAYIRVDTIETAVGRAEGRFGESNEWEQPPGYLIGYQLAADQLRIGVNVVAESVNPVRSSRDGWRAAGLAVGGMILEVEVWCSNPAEHRRRSEERVLDIPDLSKQTWEQISNREYHPWERDRLVLDTADLSVEQSVQRVLDAARSSSSVKLTDPELANSVSRS